jgi:hypothetical protein
MGGVQEDIVCLKGIHIVIHIKFQVHLSLQTTGHLVYLINTVLFS